MSERKGWSRREFMQLIGYSTLSSAGLCSSLLPAAGRGAKARFAYVGCVGGSADAIEVFAVRGGRWEAIQRVESERPVSLALDPSRRFLYVANEIALYGGLPMGTVESFAIGEDGRLARLNRQGLALSATMPRQVAVSPDGRSLVVAVRGGGAYNVLPIEEDGRVGRVSGIVKEIGTESSPARPEMVIFDRVGRVVAADGGADRLSVFALSESGMSVHARAAMQAGNGTWQIAMHPKGTLLYVMHEDSLLCYGYDAAMGRILERRHVLPTSRGAAGLRGLAVHPTGEFLYGCRDGRGLAAWRVDASSGALRAMGRQAEEMGKVDAIEISPNGEGLVALNRERGVVVGADVDAATGRLGGAVELARARSAQSIAVVYG